MFDQVFLSSQVKRSVIISSKDVTLSKDSRLKILEN